jgi:hypothetical protein
MVDNEGDDEGEAMTHQTRKIYEIMKEMSEILLRNPGEPRPLKGLALPAKMARHPNQFNQRKSTNGDLYQHDQVHPKGT